jgi:hypothetical protein
MEKTHNVFGHVSDKHTGDIKVEGKCIKNKCITSSKACITFSPDTGPSFDNSQSHLLLKLTS